MSREDIEAMETLEKGTIQRENNQYQAPMLWCNEEAVLPNNPEQPPDGQQEVPTPGETSEEELIHLQRHESSHRRILRKISALRQKYSKGRSREATYQFIHW